MNRIVLSKCGRNAFYSGRLNPFVAPFIAFFPHSFKRRQEFKKKKTGPRAYLDVRMLDHVEQDPLDDGHGRVRSGAEQIRQHVVQLRRRERSCVVASAPLHLQ